MENINKSANYHFIEDKAYTVDNVLVYNVFVSNIPKKISKTEFTKYFETFGDVVKAHFKKVTTEKFHYRKTKIGFVNFKDPVTAASVLKKKVHTLKMYPILVKACHSRYQPNAQPVALTATEIVEMETNEVSLLNLNEDCLDAIYKHLQIKDQTNLAQCCSRLKDVFVMRAKIEYKTLQLFDMEYLSVSEARNFLQMAGPHIQKIKCQMPWCHLLKSAVDFIGLYCENLKSISISNNNMSTKHLKKLLKKTNLVEELYLERVELMDSSISLLKKLTNLKKLILVNNASLTGRDIKCLTTVEELSLSGCSSILPGFFKVICKNLKDLKLLDIQGCLSLDASSTIHIVNNLKKLETLIICCENDTASCIASLPNLKKLHLYSSARYNTVHIKIIKELANLKADQLEVLAILSRNCLDQEKVVYISKLTNLKELMCPNNEYLNDDWLQELAKLQKLESLDLKDCNRFTATGLLDLIENCKNLKTLNISKCNQLDEKFAAKLLVLLKKRKQNNVFKLIASASKIPRSLVESHDFEEASHLLSIEFVNDYRISLSHDLSELEDSDFDDEDYFYDHRDDYSNFSDSDDYDDNFLMAKGSDYPF